jgi:O-acetyl-ADP-ribose deacetylase (regulator of RNase III)
MITYVVGDIFRSPAKVLVNTVNTKGIMGKGLAKDFKAIYPEMFRKYQHLCEEKRFDVGQLYLFRTPNKWVLNFPTKRDWKHPSRPQYIEAGLKAFVNGYAKAGITSVAFPQLGCGHGDHTLIRANPLPRCSMTPRMASVWAMSGLREQGR